MTTTVIQLTGVDNALALLRSLPPEVVSKRGGPVLQSLRRGARVIIKEAKNNLSRVTSNVGKDGKNHSTGLLVAKNLSALRKNPAGGIKGEMVRIRVRRAIYPSGNKISGRKFSTNDAAYLLEFGSVKQPAEPWLKPAFNATAAQAIYTVESELIKAMDRIVRKLGKQGGLS